MERSFIQQQINLGQKKHLEGYAELAHNEQCLERLVILVTNCKNVTLLSIIPQPTYGLSFIF